MARDSDGVSNNSKTPADESLNCGLTCTSSPPDCSGDAADGAKEKKEQLLSGEADGGGEIESLNVDEFAGVAAFGESLNCALCFQLPERPVTIPCGHNFCLSCFEKWINRGNLSCAKCRSQIPNKTASNPRVNSSLVSIIRSAKVAESAGPENVFRAKRPKKTEKANTGIFVTTPSDHFGPIPASNDPVRNQGVLVGECWSDRAECRQWGVHFAHVSSIAGQSYYGAQSVAISGGYKDDEDHGEWFLFTGSGKGRTNEDQKFEELNEALRVSCKFGYPVRVVRSYREKNSAYAPEEGVRYDGVYRIEKCWQIARMHDSFKVCRYLFVRCDNEPAPWTSDEHGDRPRPLPSIAELDRATDLFERSESPSWDFDEGEGRWRWMKPPPVSQKPVQGLYHKESKIMRMAWTCLLFVVFIIFTGSSSILYRV
ncbi:PREDICTED: E3 ubiquitin-protein ligase ORTHRUS-LIKE 1-like [Camelina sativa]|uniref:RING-type E3 ubiquitin transferase n=1 Tax=Camelina sativa TaxID=90675 RepID=A0ABM0Y7D9_CAMSA|nr:PREDICTED: E3 ubiquitin-protein ligase ORTHRUS-LIKE 1-like [Camelina sativa]